VDGALESHHHVSTARVARAVSVVGGLLLLYVLMYHFVGTTDAGKRFLRRDHEV